MSVHVLGGVAGLVLLAVGVVSAAPHAGEWQSAEIVTFTDFDDLDVDLGGKSHKAFFVGLRPIRETTAGMVEQERVRNAVLTELKKSELFAQVVTKRGDILGLSIDAFAHRKHGFEHPWDPNKFAYCWSGWGAYNFNTYFLHTKVTTWQDNFGENKTWRDYFAQAVKKIEQKDAN